MLRFTKETTMRITQLRELQPGMIGISTAVLACILAGAPAAAGQSDVQLAFGARSTIRNFTIGTPLVCEPSVLSRGTSTCP
jgi:hypothetical protein